MNIGIIRVGQDTDVQRLIVALREIVTVLPTCDTGNAVIFCGDDNVVLEAFRRAELHDTGLTKSFTHMRDIDPRLIRAIIEGKKLQRGRFFGVFETVGLEAALSAANVALMFDAVEIAEIQLFSATGEKSFFVLTGDKASVLEAIGSAKIICMQTHTTLPTKEWRAN